MEKRNIFKLIELSAILVFALVLIYFAATGIFSSLGIDHSWPYPSK